MDINTYIKCYIYFIYICRDTENEITSSLFYQVIIYKIPISWNRGHWNEDLSIL